MHAIGAALFEDFIYDEDGQLLTSNFYDYHVPHALDMPPLKTGYIESPSPFTPLGTKGVGESGVGAPLGALTSAVENALPHLDLRLTELPLTPARVWSAIQQATEKAVV